MDKSLPTCELEKQPYYGSTRHTNALVATSVNGFDKGSAVSYDNGTTWTAIDNTIPMAVARFFDANTGYAGSFFITGPPFNGGIYKSQIAFQTEQHLNTSIKHPDLHEEKTLMDNEVKVYPTPANDVVNIALPNAFINTVSVISIVTTNGKVIETRRSKASNFVQLNVSKLTPGTYVLRISTTIQTINRLITIIR